MPSLNMPVRRLKVAILPMEILTIGKSHGKKPDRLGRPLKRFMDTRDLNGSTSGPTP